MKDKFEWSACKGIISRRLETSCGWSREKSMQVAEIAADAIRREYGGGRHYIPGKNNFFRDRVRAEFNGRNMAELSKLYGISCMTIRRYLRRK